MATKKVVTKKAGTTKRRTVKVVKLTRDERLAQTVATAIVGALAPLQFKQTIVNPPLPVPTGEENEIHEQAENLINAPVEGNKVSVPLAERADTTLDDRIKPPRRDATGSEQHMIRASRGEEQPFYSIPQSGAHNLTSLKS